MKKWPIAALAALALGATAARAQAPAQAPVPATVEDPQAYVKRTAELPDDRARQGHLRRAAAAVENGQYEGEQVLYAAIILARSYRHAAAMTRAKEYLAGKPANRELGLAVLIEACSWPDTDYAAGREGYQTFLKEFGASKARDPLRGGLPLRMTVEESMARLNILDNEDQEAAARHYLAALDAAATAPRGTLSTEQLFNLRWYRSDAMAAAGKLDEAIAYLHATRPLVKDDPKSALHLEDRIVFKETAKLMDERRYADARALIERQLPLFAADPILTRRSSKLLDRLKLLDTAAPEFTPGHWIGGKERSLASMRGRVVMLEFLTSG